MENDFNRLLQTSQAVEEKLAQVTASDDTIQAVQVQIRKLSDALADTEDQYQRLEKKNQTLETTNAGIDRNFRTLQEAEEDINRFTGELDHITQEQEKLQSSLERLAGESEKAQTAAEKISLLSDELPSIEKRIESIQVAREWLARTETRLTALDKDIQDRLKLLGDIMKDESGKPKIKGSPPIGTRESVVKLARQGWKVDEIARAVKLSRSEVELILEINPKD
jgi:chromosome segregation ATPase